MKIEKIESFVVCQDLRQSFYFSQWEYASRSICLVRITLEDGIYGWGEGYGPAGVVASAVEFYSPHLIGMDALEHERCWQILYRRSLDYARSGAMLAGLSAIDIALWDIKGKLLGQPVWKLLGGLQNEWIRPYATGLYFSNGSGLKERLVNEALGYIDSGIDAIKMKVGLGVAVDADHVAAVRKAIGPSPVLAVDSNHAYSPREAFQLCQRLEPMDIGWFEEPISPELYEEYRLLRSRTSIPIAGGECEYLCHGFLRLFQHGSVAIAQPDVAAAGGITETRKIIHLASVFGVDVIPHSWGTGIAFSAAMHLIANMPMQPGRLMSPIPFIEMDMTENPLRDQLVTPRFCPDNGRLRVTDAPGLGIDVDLNLLEQFMKPRKTVNV
jgi:D-galactarolactone cycloisomerase